MEKELIEFITSIARFPSLNIWQRDGLYYCECSPSFETVRREGFTLQKALLNLLDGLYRYLSEDEIACFYKIINKCNIDTTGIGWPQASEEPHKMVGTVRDVSFNEYEEEN